MRLHTESRRGALKRTIGALVSIFAAPNLTDSKAHGPESTQSAQTHESPRVLCQYDEWGRVTAQVVVPGNDCQRHVYRYEQAKSEAA